MISLLRLKHAKRDQNGNQHRERRNGVKHAGSQIEEVIANRSQGNVIAQNVADQLEECKDQHQHYKAGQYQHEHSEEFANHVRVKKPGKDSARTDANRPRLQPFQDPREMLAILFHPNLRKRDARDPFGNCGQHLSAACHLPKQE